MSTNAEQLRRGARILIDDLHAREPRSEGIYRHIVRIDSVKLPILRPGLSTTARAAALGRWPFSEYVHVALTNAVLDFNDVRSRAKGRLAVHSDAALETASAGA